jgi:hypothetical protein
VLIRIDVRPLRLSPADRRDLLVFLGAPRRSVTSTRQASLRRDDDPSSFFFHPFALLSLEIPMSMNTSAG